MKLASFSGAQGPSYGIVTDAGVVEAPRELRQKYPTLRAAVAADALRELSQYAQGRSADIALADVNWLSPITDPDKILCIGLNYRKHAAESGKKVPEKPSTFIRLTNTLAPHNTPILLPKLSGDLDYECELALVIGKKGRHIPEADALTYVAGYTCFNDASVRDFQFNHSLAVGKNFLATGGIGPWIVTPDEIPNPGRLAIRTRLNGQEVQSSRTDDLIFSVPWIISYFSGMTELLPGDIIATGTPEGCGFAKKPPLWMKAGDVVDVEIENIGVLRNPIVAER